MFVLLDIKNFYLLLKFFLLLDIMFGLCRCMGFFSMIIFFVYEWVLKLWNLVGLSVIIYFFLIMWFKFFN